MHFFPSILSSLASLEVPGHTKSPPALHKKSLGLTYMYIWTGLHCLEWYLMELPFERYQTGSLSHCGCQGIPETNWLRKEAVLVVVTGSGNSSVFKRVTRPSPCRCRCQVLFCRYVHKAMHNFEEHDQLVLGSSWLQGFLFQVVQHRGHANCVMVSVCDIPGCSTLNHLNLLAIFLGIGTPNSRTILL